MIHPIAGVAYCTAALKTEEYPTQNVIENGVEGDAWSYYDRKIIETVIFQRRSRKPQSPQRDLWAPDVTLAR